MLMSAATGGAPLSQRSGSGRGKTYWRRPPRGLVPVNPVVKSNVLRSPREPENEHQTDHCRGPHPERG